MSKKKILITGGTGFIGYHLASECLKRKFLVTSISVNKPNKLRKLNKVKYLYCDISNKKKLYKILDKNYDFVVNLAGYVDHTMKKKTKESHYIGCKNLALFFLNTKISKFVQIGSSVEYGKLKSPHIENNKNSQKTHSVYGFSKLLSTKFLLGLNQKLDFPVSILRLYLAYGPYQEINRVIPITINKAIKKKNFACSGGLQLRDFLYIDDVIKSIFKVLYNKNANGEIFNIGSGKPLRVKYVINKICRVIGSGKPEFGKIKLRKDEPKSLYPSINKAKKLLKWRPIVGIDIGLKKTITYYKNIK